MSSISLSKAEHIAAPKRKIVFLIILVAKAVLVLWYSHTIRTTVFDNQLHGFAYTGGDALSYLQPFDHLIEEGKFYFTNEKGQQIFVGRGPYYGLPYFLFRQVCSRENALMALALLQIILSAYAMLLLWILSFLYIRSEKWRWIFLITLLVNLHITSVDICLQTESLSISLLVISLYSWMKYLELGTARSWWISSLSFCWAALLKPYLLPFAGLTFLITAFYSQWKWFYFTRKLVLFYMPILFMTLPYTARNYCSYQRLVPIQDRYAGYGYNEADIEVRRFIQSYGGSFLYWDADAAGSFFMTTPRIGTHYVFPANAFASCYNLDSLKNAAADYKLLLAQKNADTLLVASLAARMHNYSDCLAKERPFLVLVGSRIIILKRFLFHSGSYLFPRQTTLQLIVKLIQSVVYYIMLLGSLMAILLTCLYRKNWSLLTWILLAGFLFPILLFPFVIKSDEWRYMDNAFPYMVVLVAMVFGWFEEKLKNHQDGNNSELSN